MEPNEKKKKTGAEKIRERFFERTRNWKPSPELEEIIKQQTPNEEKDESDQPEKKIARPRRSEDLDL